MSKSQTTVRSRAGGIISDERARVPLAVVGVLLLLSSAILVGQLETGEEPGPNVDASLALDQTEATLQTVARDSAKRAAKLAAAQPVTDPADTRWGAVLERSEPRFADDPFENYLRALVYLELRDSLDHAGQTDGDIRTAVQIPAVDTPTELGEAIERVTLERSGAEVTVTLSNVTVTATRAGKEIERRTTNLTVTVVTPVLEMHDRVTAYQYAIDEAPITEPGFRQRFNARTYAIGWARGWAQNYQAPVGEVLANRHIEPSANAALYRTQQDIFGAADPDLQNAVRLGWACMALKDGQALFKEYTTDNQSGAGMPDVAGRVCNNAHAFYNRITQRQSALPEAVDVLAGPSQLRQTKTVAVGELAAMPLTALTDDSSQYSFESAIQRIFTIEGQVATETDVRGSVQLDVGCRVGYRGGPVSREGRYEIQAVNRTESDAQKQYYRYTAAVTVTVSAERTCRERDGNTTVQRHDTDRYTIEMTTTVGEQEASPAAKIDDVNPRADVSPAYAYTPGPSGRDGTVFNNYDGAGDAVTEALLGGTGTASYEDWLEVRMDDTNYERRPPLDRQFEATEAVKLDYEALLGDFRLFAELTEDIRTLQTQAANVSAEVERRELVTGNPTSRLLDRLRSEFKSEFIERPDGEDYENVREKVVYEARYAYYRALVEQLEGVETAHETATAELDDRLAAIDSAFANGTRFLAQGLRQRQATPDAFPASDVTENISYEISGSPTYLGASQTVDSEQVPAVDGEFAPLRTRNVNAVELPYDTAVNEILAAVLEALPGTSATPDAELSFRMAGDVLSAGELALEAHESAQASGRQDTYLDEAAAFESDIESFAKNVEAALDAFEREVAKRTVAALYPSPASDCLVYAKTPRHDSYPGRETCASATDSDLEPVVQAAVSATEDGVRRALAPYGTAETARLLGDGNATEHIVDNVTRALAGPRYRGYDAFEKRYETEQWGTLVGAAVRPAVMTASSTSIEIGSVTKAEALDERIQDALGRATTALVEDRVANAGEAVGRTVGEHWLGNAQRTANRAARVPAGLPLLPVPSQWVATANAWTVEVAGKYARFEVSARLGTPADGPLTYVRENRTVSRKIGGQERRLGVVEPITFDSQTVLVVVTPPGVGVGDRGGQNPECSPTYPHVGEVDSGQSVACGVTDG